MKTLSLLVVIVALSGCAASRPEAAPEAPRTLAEIDSIVRGGPAQVVLLDGYFVDLDRVIRVASDTIRGRREGVDLAVATEEVQLLRVPGDEEAAPSSCGTAALCAFPAGVLTLLLATDPEDGDFVEGKTIAPCAAVAAAGCAIAGAGLSGAFSAGPPPTLDRVLVIAPLSQFEDAPRGGVGIRP